MLTVMTGPCVLEDMDTVLKIAEKLRPLSLDKRVDFYFKASFDKANRTSLSSFRGPGLDEGLRIFEKIKKEFGYKVVTDIHRIISSSTCWRGYGYTSNTCFFVSSNRFACSCC